MKEYKGEEAEIKNVLREDPVAYGNTEEQDNARLQEALKRTDSEKFYYLMTLMKMGNTMRKAVIHHKK